MNFTLVISAAPELQAVLEKIADGLTAGWQSIPTVEDSLPENKTPALEPKIRQKRTSKDPVIETPKVDDGLEDDTPVYTVEVIRALAKERATAVGADKVRGLIKELGFEKLPDLTPDKYAEFAEKVAKLVK